MVPLLSNFMSDFQTRGLVFLRFQGQGDVDQCKDYLDVLWNRLAASDWSLMVKNASMEDSGMYECQVNLVVVALDI